MLEIPLGQSRTGRSNVMPLSFQLFVGFL